MVPYRHVMGAHLLYEISDLQIGHVASTEYTQATSSQDTGHNYRTFNAGFLNLHLLTFWTG